MKKGRMKRNKVVLIVGIAAILAGGVFKISPSKINNFTDIMSASLSFSALATAMFLSSFSLIPAFSNSKFINALKELGTDIKIMDRLLISTLIFFISSLMTFILLFFDCNSNSLISNIITTLWLSFTSMGFASTFYVIAILIKGFEHYYESQVEKNHE
ncbi:hypothetical protein HF860_10660 [Enterococcus gallinarum]|uniref:hypothetical protein n=1 Tax=Enterococcus gallinarum TaxID=1353 RepID=UPI0014752347|nr:hypothetical protein [Enterococcus gallinarum]NME47616.1 hypothetical protein [Enterococcus gallinarum]